MIFNLSGQPTDRNTNTLKNKRRAVVVSHFAFKAFKYAPPKSESRLSPTSGYANATNI
jgi:hypothetical protein